MNERQTQELQELLTLESAGTIEEAQKSRLDELNAFKALVEKSADVEKISKDFESAKAQKEHFRAKFEAEEKLRKDAEARANAGGNKEGLKVEDFIDISASLEGLDQKEKERIAREHKLTGKSLSEIRKDEDFLLWQSAYKAKVEKEKQQIIPSNKQPDDNSPFSLEDALNAATSLEEKEKILAETTGYSVGKQSGPARVKIG